MLSCVAREDREDREVVLDAARGGAIWGDGTRGDGIVGASCESEADDDIELVYSIQGVISMDGEKGEEVNRASACGIH